MPGHQQCHAPTMRGSSSQGCPLIRRMASAALTCDRGHSPAYPLRKPASARPSVPVGAPRKHRNAWRASNSQPVARSSTRATTSTTLARPPAIELLDLPGRQIAGYCTALPDRERACRCSYPHPPPPPSLQLSILLASSLHRPFLLYLHPPSIAPASGKISTNV